MASSSGSPRSRIDQFFPSRKRRPNAEKDPKFPTDASSPSAKGSLEAFLVKSPDAQSQLGSPSRGDRSRRSLVLDASRTLEGAAGADTPLDGGPDEPSDRGSRPELRKFTNDFLSHYCSELQSATDAPAEENLKGGKRNVSPSLLIVNAKTCAKKHRVVDGDDILVEDEKLPCRERDCSADAASEAGAVAVECTKGNADAGLESEGKAEPSISLRRCSNAGNENWSKARCLTPCSSVHVARTDGSPKSASRSSMFSPGEEFWNEAIHVADGLVVPHDKPSSQLAILFGDKNKDKPCIQDSPESGRSSSKLPGETLTSDLLSHPDVQSSGFCGVPNAHEVVGKTIDMVGECLVEPNLRLSTKSLKSQSESSPLPVKHFDFLLEGHTLKEIGVERNLDGPTVVTDHHSRTMIPNHEPQSCRGCSPGWRKKSEVEADSLSSVIPFKDTLQLSNWLPTELCAVYMKKGISKLYPWQVDCLNVDGVLDKKNLVYCASTSAGKSFVAEILMLRQVISAGKMAILVLPYVSICAEKAEHLEGLLEPVGKHVRSFYGNEGGGSLPKDTSVAVCTIEKANVLVNRLLEEDRLSEVGIIVIDELHMVGDQHRGYLLELMLTKLRYASGDGSLEASPGESSGSSSCKIGRTHGLQVIGMSATMPNVSAVADWLQAAFYQTDFRPVPLEEYIKVGNTIFDKQLNPVRVIAKGFDQGGKDPDHVVQLCNEVIVEGHSVLIFCSSRKGCESTARHISKFLGKCFSNISDNDDELTLASAIDALRRCPAGLDPILEETVRFGVAYHHAGLTVEEREIVESLFRKGFIRVLTATSTLAAGVNLPARRVIFRQPRIGRDFIDGTRYRQMAGRAGRTGIDTKGESILICKPEELKRISALLNDGCPPLQSCLSEDKNGMTHAILEVVAGGIVLTANDIHRYVRCTLLNSTKPFQDVVMSAQDSLRWLCHNKFLEWNEETSLYSSTPLGRAAFGSSLSPEESLIVLDDLIRAREGLVLASDLHMVYLVTPINIDIEPDWELYYERFMELSALEQSVGNRVGVVEPFLMRMAHGAPMRIREHRHGKQNLSGKWQSRGNTKGCTSDSDTLRVSKRFYVALMLSRLVQELPVPDVCDAFKVARGMIQSLQENAGRFASMVSLFCERLGWQDLSDLIVKFQSRVSFGVRAEIVELTSIPFVKGSRARALYKAGLRTPLAIAESSIPDIARALFDTSSWTAEGTLPMRKMQFGVAKKIKNGARRIVLEKAEEARVAAFSAFQSLGVHVPQFSVILPSSEEEVLNKQDSVLSVKEAAVLPSKTEVKANIDLSALPNIPEGIEGYNERKDRMSDIGILNKYSTKVDLLNDVDKNPDVTVPNMTHASSVRNNISLANSEGVADGNANISSLLPEQVCEDNSERPNFDRQLEHDKGNLSFQPGNVALGSGPTNAGRVPGGIDTFLEQWEAVGEFFFDLHFVKRTVHDSPVLYELLGLAVCWKDSPIYYVDISKDLTSSYKFPLSVSKQCSYTRSNMASPTAVGSSAVQRWSRMAGIMSKNGVRKITWNLKTQIQVLKSSGISIQRFNGFRTERNGFSGLELVDSTHIFLPSIILQDGFDLCLLVWVLWPDEENSCSNLDKTVKKHLSPDAVAAANHDGRWKNQMHKVALDGCCRRAAQTRALSSALWSVLISENLLDVLTQIENPLVNVLADMENWGIGVNLEGCLHARQILGKKLKELETEAFKLAGVSFSLYSTADIANILYTQLKLPRPEGGNKGKQHPSTDKHSLELLRDQHPIIPVIKEHRTLSKLFNSTLGSICSKAHLCSKSQKYIIKGHWLQTSTATGRLSMEDPNLQCVEHSIEFSVCNYVQSDAKSPELCRRQINARDFFIPTQHKWILLTADYSQIELRLMAHFSRDSSLIDILTRPDGDVFIMIAARWTRKSEGEISSQEREHTKRLVYGILYGMGASTLAEQLECDLNEAKEKIHSFKASFPGVSTWLQEAVELCRKRGFIETLMGRKRYLSKIKIGTIKEKAKAQRQAVNSICQGSAADIIKIAMIKIYSVISEEYKEKETFGIDIGMRYGILKGHCHLLLQVHDELVMEVDPSFVNEAGSLLQDCMETAATLLVPLCIKLKVGESWGSLQPFEPKL